MNDKHLWEIDHPYYCSDTNYFSNECDWEYSSWAAFMQDMGNADLDMNLIFRWDWEDSTNPDYELDADVLKLFYMQQRKGKFVVVTVSVVKENEDAIRAFLETRWLHLQKLWTPFTEVVQAE